jgi:hypothetical protein
MGVTHWQKIFTWDVAQLVGRDKERCRRACGDSVGELHSSQAAAHNLAAECMEIQLSFSS